MSADAQGIVLFVVVLAAVIVFLLVRHFTTRGGPIELRPTKKDPRARDVIPALRAGDVGPLVALLESLGTDWDARAYYLDDLVVDCTRESLDALCKEQPGPIASLIRGCHSIHWASQATGRLAAERMTLAKRDLSMAADADPKDPTPVANLVVVAGAQRAADDVAWEHFSAAVAIEPDHWLAHEAMRAKLSRRAGGSDEKMLEFVEKRVAEAPAGSDLPMLLFAAHLDVWSRIHDVDRDPSRALEYLKQPAVRDALYAAYDRSLGADCRVRTSTIRYRNMAAFVFYVLEDVKRLRAELEHIGDAFTEHPWASSRAPGSQTSDIVLTAKMLGGVR